MIQPFNDPIFQMKALMSMIDYATPPSPWSWNVVIKVHPDADKRAEGYLRAAFEECSHITTDPDGWEVYEGSVSPVALAFAHDAFVNDNDDNLVEPWPFVVDWDHQSDQLIYDALIRSGLLSSFTGEGVFKPF